MKIIAAVILALCVADCASGSTPLAPSVSGVTPQSAHVRPAYTLLYSFKAGNDGRDPHGGPLVEVQGTLYGTTEYGGGVCKGRCFGGTVYSVSTAGAEQVIYSLDKIAQDGKNPRAGLISVAGTLYGTTVHGGSASCYCGTVFKVTTAGAESVLHNFSGGPADGEGPDAPLLNVNGTLYGTAINGGSHGDGMIFAITPSGTETVLHNFAGKPDGAHSYAGLIEANGTIYGTTVDGGAYGDGTVFTLSASGAESVLYSFKGGTADGKFPMQAPLLDVNGTLYGTTQLGGANGRGTVFSITTSGQESLVHSFGSSVDGSLPYGGLIDVKGVLYGVTSNGGTGPCLRYRDVSGCGTVFETTTSGTESVLHSFGISDDGKYPYGGLIDVDGTLYGTATAGGAKNAGAVFSLTP